MKEICLVGSPNSGKSTLFNCLTGGRQKVGNFPGVTVAKHSGKIHLSTGETTITDLPGLYSLCTYSVEESITQTILFTPSSDILLQVLDGNNLERGLFLTYQLMTLKKPLILAINMADELVTSGQHIDVDQLKAILGIPIYLISALKQHGISALLSGLQDLITLPNEESIGAQKPAPLSESEIDYLSNPDAPIDQLELCIMKIYQCIDACIIKCVSKTESSDQIASQQALDRMLTSQWIGLPLFCLMMYFVFWMTFHLGGVFSDMIDVAFSDWLMPATSSLFSLWQLEPWLSALIIEGGLSGMCGVLTFLPNIMILFASLAILEDSGYMARVAFMMDRLMGKIGLNGKAIVPLLMGFGCNAPAIMGARVLEKKEDRLVAILINPFMSCGARLPIYVLLSSIFFPMHGTLVTFSLYFLGLFVATLSALLFKQFRLSIDTSPFLLELPPYRMPSVKSLLVKVWHHSQSYLKRAGTVILAASVILWYLLNFGPNGNSDLTHSFGRYIGDAVSPIFIPLGFGTWQASLSLLTGLVAKEIVISNMAIIFGASGVNGLSNSGLIEIFTPASAYAFMVFCLLYIPCIAVISMIKSETQSWKWPLFSMLHTFSAAWFFSFLAYQIAQLLT